MRSSFCSFGLGIAGAAASALASECCCHEMHETASPCESVSSAACCDGPVAVHATTQASTVPKALAVAPAVEIGRAHV